MKKKILIIGIIVVLVLMVLGTFLYKNNKKLSKEEFLALIKKFENISNVKLQSKTMTKYVKENDVVSIRKDGVYTWTNSKTKESILWAPEHKIYSILKYKEDTGLENFEFNFIRI